MKNYIVYYDLETPRFEVTANSEEEAISKTRELFSSKNLNLLELVNIDVEERETLCEICEDTIVIEGDGCAKCKNILCGSCCEMCEGNPATDGGKMCDSCRREYKESEVR